jgi:hypothetical protein
MFARQNAASEEDEQKQKQWCEEINQYQMGRALTGETSCGQYKVPQQRLQEGIGTETTRERRRYRQ